MVLRGHHSRSSLTSPRNCITPALLVTLLDDWLCIVIKLNFSHVLFEMNVIISFKECTLNNIHSFSFWLLMYMCMRVCVFRVCVRVFYWVTASCICMVIQQEHCTRSCAFSLAAALLRGGIWHYCRFCCSWVENGTALLKDPHRKWLLTVTLEVVTCAATVMLNVYAVGILLWWVIILL